MNSYFTIYDQAGTHKYFSKEVENVLGYNSDELVGKFAYDYFYLKDLKRISKSHSEIIKPDFITSASYRMIHKNGTLVWVKSHSQRIENELISFTYKMNIFQILLFKLKLFFK